MVESKISASRKSLLSDALPSGPELLKVAADPGTHPDLLIEIHKTSKRNPAIQAALARNPATPTKLLQVLWKKDLAALFENPIVTFWEFSKPGSAKQHLSVEVQFALYQHFLAQPEFDPAPHLVDPERLAFSLGRPSRHPLRIPLHQVVRDTRPKIRLQLLEHQVRHACRTLGRPVGFPHEAILALATGVDRDVDEALASALADDCLRPEPLDPPFLGRIARLLLEKRAASMTIARNVAKWPCIDSEIVERLARRADEHFLSVLAAHPQASPALQERLAAHASETVRAGLAAATPIAHLIQKLASDSNQIVRAALASSPHIPHDIQRLLFEKKDPRILQALLENPRTAPDILEDFARLRFLSIEHRLRTHPNTPPHVRERLAKSNSSSAGPSGQE
jgi:hypothetical protein